MFPAFAKKHLKIARKSEPQGKGRLKGLNILIYIVESEDLKAGSTLTAAVTTTDIDIIIGDTGDRQIIKVALDKGLISVFIFHVGKNLGGDFIPGEKTNTQVNRLGTGLFSVESVSPVEGDQRRYPGSDRKAGCELVGNHGGQSQLQYRKSISAAKPEHKATPIPQSFFEREIFEGLGLGTMVKTNDQQAYYQKG